jgi:hypothetical protein
MNKHFAEIKFYTQRYRESAGYQERLHFLTHEATVDDLRVIWEDLQQVIVQLVFGGRNKHLETIGEHFWIWRRGTTVAHIERFLEEQRSARLAQEQQNREETRNNA